MVIHLVGAGLFADDLVDRGAVDVVVRIRRIQGMGGDVGEYPVHLGQGLVRGQADPRRSQRQAGVFGIGGEGGETAVVMLYRQSIGSGAVGNGVGKQTTLIDFTTSNLYGFETLGLIKLSGRFMEDNEASRKILERFGFTDDTTKSESIYKRGKKQRILTYSLTKEEYCDLKK